MPRFVPTAVLAALIAACATPPPMPPSSLPLPAGPAAAAPATSGPLTVPDAVALALARNPDLAAAAARIAAAEGEVAVARTYFSPRIGVSVGYTQSTDPVFVFSSRLRQRDLRMAADFNDPGSYGNARASLEAAWLLADGGRREARVNMAQLAALVERGGRAALMNELKASVISTCLAVFEAREHTRVARESVRLVEEQERIARSRFEAGSSQRSDVLTVEVRLAEAKEGVVRAENAGLRALSALRFLAGVPAGEPFELAEAPGFRVPPVTEEDPLATARANRPEVSRARRAVDLATAEVGLREADRRPTVSVFGSWDFDDRKGAFDGGEDSRTGGVRFDLPVFEGYRSAAEVSAAQARVREAEENVRRAVLAVEADVRQADLSLREAQERVRVSEKAEELAVEALALIRARYEGGTATITEYLDAEVALTGARARKVNARYEVERATADLRRALGICRAGAEEGGQ